MKQKFSSEVILRLLEMHVHCCRTFKYWSNTGLLFFQQHVFVSLLKSLKIWYVSPNALPLIKPQCSAKSSSSLVEIQISYSWVVTLDIQCSPNVCIFTYLTFLPSRTQFSPVQLVPAVAIAIAATKWIGDLIQTIACSFLRVTTCLYNFKSSANC